MSVSPVSNAAATLSRPNQNEYTVKSGDTLSGIAAKHGISLAALEAANPQIKNPNLIFPGQAVTIPDAGDGRMHTGPVGRDTGSGRHMQAGPVHTLAASTKKGSSDVGNNPLSNLIERGESGGSSPYWDSPYNAWNGGTSGGRIVGADHRIDFSKLTLGQVMQMGSSGQVFAIGRYQIIPGTLRSAVNALNLDTSQKFTPALQEQIFSDYLISKKRPDVRGYITGESGVSKYDAEKALCYEWASIGDPDKGGASHYGHGNAASISPQEAGRALDQMRAQYSAQIQKGASPAEAWHTVTNSSGSLSGPAPSPSPAPAPAPAPSPSSGTYTVRSGDTLSGIAAHFGVSLSALERANPQIGNPNLIHIGQTINIPGQGGGGSSSQSHDYTVRRGDTMSGIASRNGVSLSALEAANPQIGNPNLIHIGQTIHIPGKGGSDAPSQSHDYTVRRGDTMSGIASRNGVSLSALEAANPQIGNPNLIHIGQTIHIPGKGGSSKPSKPASHDYTVRSGDTMSGIAARNGVSLSALERANPQISNPDRISVGQTIHIPGKGDSGGSSKPSKPASHDYTVRSGDTMSGIAARNGVSLSALERANPQISNPDRISVGQTIHIPGAGPVGGGGSVHGTNAASIAHGYYGMYASQLEDQGVIIDGVDTTVCCANFVTSMLIQAGEVPAHGMNFVQRVNVSAMSNYLQAHGWSVVPRSQAKPGDVWVSGSEGHTELVYGNNHGSLKLIGSNNHPVWHNQQVNYSYNVTSGYVLAPPN